MGKANRHAVFVGQRRDWIGEAVGSGVQVGMEAWQSWPKSGDFALKVCIRGVLRLKGVF